MVQSFTCSTSSSANWQLHLYKIFVLTLKMLVAATSTQVHTMLSHWCVWGGGGVASSQSHPQGINSWLWLGRVPSANWCWAKPTHRLTLPADGATSGTWGQWLLWAASAWGGVAPEGRLGQAKRSLVLVSEVEQPWVLMLQGNMWWCWYRACSAPTQQDCQSTPYNCIIRTATQ